MKKTIAYIVATPLNPRLLSQDFIDKLNFVGTRYGGNGEIANIVNADTPTTHSHTQFKNSKDILPLEKMELTVKPISELNTLSTLFVVSGETNSKKTPLAVVSVDTKTDSCVISGLLVDQYEPGDSNARVMFDNQDGTLSDVGFVLSKVFSDDFEMMLGLRVATDNTPQDIFDIYQNDEPLSGFYSKDFDTYLEHCKKVYFSDEPNQDTVEIIRKAHNKKRRLQNFHQTNMTKSNKQKHQLRVAKDWALIKKQFGNS
tara:strand:- start:1207 stop:1977 length:771 start_codon:yes stop_codon:yes gene_type:complete